MKTIGITGGVGAGKSQVLDYLALNYNCIIIKSDELAYELESPGHECYDSIVSLLGNSIVGQDGYIVKPVMASKIFGNRDLLEAVNDIIHPAVRKEILARIAESENEGKIDFFFLEAALLIEEGYDKILDQLWYIKADREVRRKRLRESRAYTDEKIDRIFASQLSDDEYAVHCKIIIDNSGDIEDTYRQIDAAMSLAL